MNTMQPHAYVLNVMSDDHPGIVAAVGRSVTDAGGNIDACSQTVLEGYFTLIMVVSFPAPVEADALAGAIRHGHDGFQVAVRPLVDAPPPTPDADRLVITAFGDDKPGIVLRFSQYLAGKDVNIVDMFGDREGDRFMLICQVEAPPRIDIGMLQADLEEMGAEEGFTVRCQHENVFVATNQLRLTSRP